MSDSRQKQDGKNRVDISPVRRNMQRHSGVFVRRVKATEGNAMRVAMFVTALVTSLGLAACQTASTIDGVRLPVQSARGGDTFCERNFILCIAGGALVAGGAALAASGGHHSDPPNGTTPGVGMSGGNNRGAIP